MDAEQLRVYFPYQHVLDGMFTIYQTIFGLKFEQVQPPYKWIGDLQLYAVSDAKTGEPLGLFYLDMFPRDALGVTAAFNLNLLARINRELGGRFDLAAFRHRAVWNAELSRMEMHIVSRTEQRVAIEGLGLEVSFGAGETVLSECSYKFDEASLCELAAATGFERTRGWTDPDGLFSSSLLRAV